MSDSEVSLFLGEGVVIKKRLYPGSQNSGAWGEERNLAKDGLASILFG